MASIKEIYRYTFSYKRPAFLTIFFNLLYVIFNLVSLILFIPFLQLIFEKPEDMAKIAKPVYHGGFLELFSYVQNSYNYTMQQMVEKDPKDALFFVCITVFIAFFLKNLFRYGAIWHQSQLRMAVVRDLKNKLYNKALRLPMKFYSDERKGDLMARMSSDVGEIEIGVIAILELIFREPFAIITSVTGLIVISPKLTLISFILLPISAFVISRIGRSLKRTAKQGQEQNGIVTSAIDESLSGVKVIKSFSAINFMTEKFEEINLRWQKLITKAFRKRDLSPPLNETLGAAVMICLVWFGGVMILEGGENSLTGKTFIAFIIVFSQLLRPIQGISTSMGNLNKAEPSMDRINEILNADEVINDVPNPIPFKALSGKIEVKHVSFKYKDEWVLQDVSFELEKGKTIALVGESGSGKSTIADLLPRFYDIQSGEILFDGISIEQLKISDLRSSIGIVSQESFLFNETIFNNIAFGLTNVNKEDVMRAAKIAHAHQFIVEMENGYETNIGDRGNKLSGGQKQRISIARAILRDPSILILDEATSALDTESERIVQEALTELMKDRTSLVIAHRLSTIQHADEILVMSKGKIVERGNHSSLMAENGIYRNLCSLQGIEN
jgi:subfamily B ATP-binding cassette protein MsbA